jgi:MFS family permease
MRLLLTLVAKVLFAELAVMAVVGPLGFAMDGKRGLSWTMAGAAVWSLVFALAAIWLQRSVLGWGLAGGFICGAAWSFGYVIGEDLVTLTYQSYNFGWAAVFGAFGGVGAGLMAGAATAVVPDPAFRRAVRLGAWAAAVCWGGLAAGVFPLRGVIGSIPQAVAWGLGGTAFGLAAMPLGWLVGKRLSPVVVFFEELGPYLAEMARPLAVQLPSQAPIPCVHGRGPRHGDNSGTAARRL